MLPRALLVLVAVTSGCYGEVALSRHWLRLLPWETRDNLLQLQPHLEVKQLTGQNSIGSNSLLAWLFDWLAGWLDGWLAS